MSGGFGEVPVDPCTPGTLATRRPWPLRLRATTAPGWSAATLLRAVAPLRTVGRALLDEASLTALVVLVPEASLDPAPGRPLVERLRALHDRLTPAGVGRTHVATEDYPIGGWTGVLDRFRPDATAVMPSCSLAVEVAPGIGLVGLAWGPPGRSEALDDVATPLLGSAGWVGGRLAWALPSGWVGTEELQLTTPQLMVTARLEALAPGATFDEWVDLVFARAPFLRDMQLVGDRDVTVGGADRAHLWRFDWQPSGTGRVLTTVVVGTAGGDGFTLTFEIPFDGPGDHLLVDPDAVLSMVTIDPVSTDAPDPLPVPAPPPPLAPPPAPGDAVALGGVRVGVDRMVRALVDLVDGDRSAATHPLPQWAADAAGRLEATHVDPARHAEDVDRLDGWCRAVLDVVWRGRRPPVVRRPAWQLPAWAGPVAARVVEAEALQERMEEQWASYGLDSEGEPLTPAPSPPPPPPAPPPPVADVDAPVGPGEPPVPLSELCSRAERAAAIGDLDSPDWLDAWLDLRRPVRALVLGGEAPFAAAALAVAGLVVAAFDDGRADGRSAVDVLAELDAELRPGPQLDALVATDEPGPPADDPDPWSVRRPGLDVRRPATYDLVFQFVPGRRELVGAANDAARERWGTVVDHRELVIPTALAARLDALGTAWIRTGRTAADGSPDGSATIDFLREHAELVAGVQDDLVAVLGSAYRFD